MRTQTNKEQTARSVVQAQENVRDPVWIKILKDGWSIPDQSQNKNKIHAHPKHFPYLIEMYFNL